MKEPIKKTEKTPARSFFERIKPYNINTNWNDVEKIFNKKSDILNNFSDEIITQIEEREKENGEFYAPIKDEIFIGVAPEQPNAEPELFTQYLKISFLKELEHIGLVSNLKETSREEFDNGSWWIKCYVEITFFPSELKKYLKENKGSIINKKPSNFYIIDDNGYFKFNGLFLKNLSKEANYYIVFSALFRLLPYGGEIDYNDLIPEIKKMIPKKKNMSREEFIGFILRNLTDEHNGFLHYAKIKNQVIGGGKLIEPKRGKGIRFNNSKI